MRDINEFKALVDAAPNAIAYMQALGWAIENVENLCTDSEETVRQIYSPFALVYGVYCNDAGLVSVQIIKGEAPAAGEVVMASSIPCVDEADARRWAALLNTPIDLERVSERSIHLATIDGVPKSSHG